MKYRRIIPFIILVIMALMSVGVVQADPLVGAVSPSNSVIGQATGDQIGSGGVYILPTGNIVIVSEFWNISRGAVTCLTPQEYKAGGIVVSATNSLTAEHINSKVGGGGITILANGNFVVVSPNWGDDPAGSSKRGAVTWVNGTTCLPFGETTRGALVDSGNSLVGENELTTDDNFVGSGGVVPLINGHYVVVSPEYNDDTGAVTWANGKTGAAGDVNATNSLVGKDPNDRVASGGVYALSTGNYVVSSPLWDRDGTTVDAGAVTWINGKTGLTGLVTTANSLTGSSPSDMIGHEGVTPLINGNYIVQSASWDDGVSQNLGAVTWGSGITGKKGTINASNSIVGTVANDLLGQKVVFLTNGNYVVVDEEWNGVGAVRWASGDVVSVGRLMTSNSLFGSAGSDAVGDEVVALPNGNFVVVSPFWNNGSTVNVGAVTWGNGNGGIVGQVSPTNSMIGALQDDRIGSNGIVALTNSNYVIRSELWHTSGLGNLGAVTWCPGTGACVGVVSAANSLVGSVDGDRVGTGTDSAVHALNNGNYVVVSPTWNAQGAVTWGDGATGISGAVSAGNSMVGLGQVYKFLPLLNGNYVFASAGAVTFADGTVPLTGVQDTTNSIIDAGITSAVNTLGLFSLPNSNYVVSISTWLGTGPDAAGAIIFGDGVNGTVGTLSATTILTGDATSTGVHRVGDYTNVENPPVVPLGDSSYVVNTMFWNGPAQADVGAINRVTPDGKPVGFISDTNALVGSSSSDQVGSGGIVLHPDGGYLVISPLWSNLGAVTYVEGAVNLLANGGFEVAGSTKNLAQNWTGLKLLSNDKRFCGSAKKPKGGLLGQCSFQFKTSPVMGSRQLKQVIQNPSWGFTGDTLNFRVSVEGVNVGTNNKNVLLNLKYQNGTIDKILVPISGGTYPYQTLTQTITLTDRLVSFAVVFKPTAVTGQIRVDEVWLTLIPAPPLRFPMVNETRDGSSSFSAPAIPDGFRK